MMIRENHARTTSMTVGELFHRWSSFSTPGRCRVTQGQRWVQCIRLEYWFVLSFYVATSQKQWYTSLSHGEWKLSNPEIRVWCLIDPFKRYMSLTACQKWVTCSWEVLERTMSDACSKVSIRRLVMRKRYDKRDLQPYILTLTGRHV